MSDSAIKSAFIDANVITHVWTMDVLLSLAEASYLDPVWSKSVFVEAKAALLKMGKQSEEWIDAYLDTIQNAFPFAMIHDFESLDITLPDIGDLFVVEAAKAGDADYIVTYNIEDFPDSILLPIGLRAVHPDKYLCSLEISSYELRTVFEKLLYGKKHPKRTFKDEIDGLRRNGLNGFCDKLISLKSS